MSGSASSWARNLPNLKSILHIFHNFGLDSQALPSNLIQCHMSAKRGLHTICSLVHNTGAGCIEGASWGWCIEEKQSGTQICRQSVPLPLPALLLPCYSFQTPCLPIPSPVSAVKKYLSVEQLLAAHKLRYLPWKRTAEKVIVQLRVEYEYGSPRGVETINVRFTQWHGKGMKVSLWGYKFDETANEWRKKAQLFNLMKILSVPRSELEDDALSVAKQAEEESKR